MELETQTLPASSEMSSESNRRHTVRILIGTAVLLVVVTIAGVFAAIRYYAPATELWSALTLPSELRQAHFITRGTDVSVYAVTASHGYVSESTGQGRYVVYAAPKEDALFVTADPVTSTYHLELNGKVVLTSLEPITTAALSPNKKQVVYAKQREGIEASRDAADWDVILFFPATSKNIVVSPGFAPFFIDDTHVARFTNAGIYVIDTVTSTQTELLKQEFKQMLPGFSQSPDHTLIAWSDPVTKSTLVYRTGSSLTRVMAFDGFVPLFALGNSALYRMKLTPEGTTIYRYSFTSTDSARMIHTLPVSLQISALSL